MVATTTSEEPPRTDRQVLSAVTAVLRARLPRGWALETAAEQQVSPGLRADAVMTVTAPDGRSAPLIVEVRQQPGGQDVLEMQFQLDTLRRVLPAPGLVGARYLSRPVRQRLSDLGLSYVDATGNVDVQLVSPGLFLSSEGAQQDPWRGPGRPAGTLKGEPAARVVRALLDFSTSWPVTDLIDLSGASTGSVYRVVRLLEKEGLIRRDHRGEIVVPDWPALARRWSEDYGFLRSNRVSRWISPRGLPALLERLPRVDADIAYAVTGSLAAGQWAASAPSRSAFVYVTDATRAAEAWDLRSTEVGVNVLLAEPAYPVVLERSLDTARGWRVVRQAQALVDLMTAPGRGPAEAHELMSWMKVNESSWRD